MADFYVNLPTIAGGASFDAFGSITPPVGDAVVATGAGTGVNFTSNNNSVTITGTQASASIDFASNGLPLSGGTLTGSLTIAPGSSGGLVVGSADGSGNNYTITVGDSTLTYNADISTPSMTWNLGSVSNLLFQGTLLATGTVGGATIQGTGIVASLGILVGGMGYLAPTEGGADTAGAVSYLVLEPAGSLTAYTLTMPTGIISGQIFTISCTAAIASFTLTPFSGQSLSVTPSALVAGTPLRYVFRLVGGGPGGVWYPA